MASTRTFSYEEAARRRGKGEAASDIAAEYGVTPQAIYVAIKTWQKEERRRREKSNTCADCGKQIWKSSYRCQDCAAASVVIGVRPESLRCTGCKRWKSDEQFDKSRSAKHRRYRARLCKPCKATANSEVNARRRVRYTGVCETPGCGKMVNTYKKKPPHYCATCASRLHNGYWQSLVYDTLRENHG